MLLMDEIDPIFQGENGVQKLMREAGGMFKDRFALDNN